VLIQVSQSVEHDHPHSLEFLRKDCTNAIDYFRKRVSENLMSVRELFDFIVSDINALNEKLTTRSPLADMTNITFEKEDLILEAYIDQVTLI
jgi:RIO kinase 1